MYYGGVVQEIGVTMEEKWNVYAWYKHNPAVRVCEGVSISEAAFAVEAYMNRGLEWDAYMVKQDDDPGWTED